MAMNVEAEIRELKRRVGEPEGSFGFLTQQIRSVHKDLLAFQETTEQFQEESKQFQKETKQFQKEAKQFQEETKQRFDRLDRNWRDEVPKVVAATMREVLREQKTPRKSP